jgi:hypothetical protein
LPRNRRRPHFHGIGLAHALEVDVLEAHGGGRVVLVQGVGVDVGLDVRGELGRGLAPPPLLIGGGLPVPDNRGKRVTAQGLGVEVHLTHEGERPGGLLDPVLDAPGAAGHFLGARGVLETGLQEPEPRRVLAFERGGVGLSFEDALGQVVDLISTLCGGGLRATDALDVAVPPLSLAVGEGVDTAGADGKLGAFLILDHVPSSRSSRSSSSHTAASINAVQGIA